MEKRASIGESFEGMLLVNKATGMTSKDVSRWFQRRLGKIRMGHVGTLDPLAEGLLPILFGRATRLQDFLVADSKSYYFEVKFGQATDTLDSDGSIVGTASCEGLSKILLDKICLEMHGEIAQIPPMYSAIKYKGKALYKYARSGEDSQVPVDELVRKINIFSLRCLEFSDNLGKFEVHCSKGTYVRVIASTLAVKADTLGHITRLVRTASGELSVFSARTLDDLERDWDSIRGFLVPLSEIPVGMPRWISFRASDTDRLKFGQEIHVSKLEFEASLKGMAPLGTSGLDLLDRLMLVDENGQSFGIGSAIQINPERIAVRMRRGLL